jgi:hypothetical protein
MTAEEIFNMFFGGGFPSQAVYTRRAGGGGGAQRFRQQAHTQRHFHAQNQDQGQREVRLGWVSGTATGIKKDATVLL